MNVPPIEGIGRSDYEHYCALLGLQPDHLLSPAQRQAALPSWLSPELVSTPAARDKLRVYGRRHVVPRPAPTISDVLVALHCIGGDEAAATALARVLVENIPAPVRDYALERCTFIAIGARVAGFCGATNLAAPDDRRRPRLIVVSAQQSFAHVVGHEVSHAWTLSEPEPTALNGGTVWQSALYQSRQVPAAFAEEAIERRRSYARDEDVAERLAARWGFGAVFENER